MVHRGRRRACRADWPDSLNTTPGPGQGRRVLVIGDSLTRNGRKPLKRALREDGWTPTVRCFEGSGWIGRSFKPGVRRNLINFRRQWWSPSEPMTCGGSIEEQPHLE